MPDPGKETHHKYKTQEFVGLDKSIAELTADRESTDAELNAVLEYYTKERHFEHPNG